MKKFIGASSALIIAGSSVLSSASAMSMESDDGSMSMSNGANVQWQEMKEHRMETNQERKDMNQKIKEGRMEMRQENKDNRQEFKKEVKEKKQEFKQHMQEKKRALSEKLHGQLMAVVEKLTQEKLTLVLANIDKAVAKINASTITQARKDRFLTQLEEIRTIIQDKLDALTGNNPVGNILNEVLSGVIPDTSSGSTSTGTTSGTGTTAVIQ